MGLRRDEITPAMRSKMSAEDQAALGIAVIAVPNASPSESRSEPEKEQSERAEQAEFAKLLIGWKREKLCRYEWSATHKATTRIPGEPDFTVYFASGRTVFFEFKSKGGRLTPEQAAFKADVEFLGYAHYVVRTAKQAESLSLPYLPTKIDPGAKLNV